MDNINFTVGHWSVFEFGRLSFKLQFSDIKKIK